MTEAPADLILCRTEDSRTYIECCPHKESLTINAQLENILSECELDKETIREFQIVGQATSKNPFQIQGEWKRSIPDRPYGRAM